MTARPRSPTNPGERVFVTGVGVVSAICRDSVDFVEALRSGRNGIGPDPSRAGDEWASCLSAAIPERVLNDKCRAHGIEAKSRESAMVLSACAEAVAQSALAGTGANVGGTLWTTLGGMQAGLDFVRDRVAGHEAAERLRRFPMQTANDELARHFGFDGPNLVISTACAASAHAIGHAVDMIRAGQIEVAVTGGYDALSDLTTAGFGVLGLLTSDTVRPFDKDRSGLVLGEGAGILVIESACHASERGAEPLAEILGFGMTSDAFHLTAPEADGKGAARAIQLALDEAGLSTEEIGYINAHGTATRKNDSSEAFAIREVFGARADVVPVSSSKSMLGHTLGAAGAIELIATICALRNGFMPPTTNVIEQDPDFSLNLLGETPLPAENGFALSNSFGFGGNNGTIVLQVDRIGP